MKQWPSMAHRPAARLLQEQLFQLTGKSLSSTAQILHTDQEERPEAILATRLGLGQFKLATTSFKFVLGK
ncbi:hypothetical protein J6590_100043 [Homalodisca vitripennis]|nr:hypothetical protein J6590_100043 [Homalodisca vitripennis]